MLALHPRGELLDRAAADLVAALGQALARDRVPADLGQHRTRPPHNLWRRAGRAEHPTQAATWKPGSPASSAADPPAQNPESCFCKKTVTTHAVVHRSTE